MDKIIDWINNFLWDIESGAWNMMDQMLKGLVDGVLQFNALNNEIVTNGFKTMLLLMVVILPAKAVFEVIWQCSRGDIDNLNIGKKVAGITLAIVVTFSAQIAFKGMVQYVNSGIREFALASVPTSAQEEENMRKASDDEWKKKYANNLTNQIGGAVLKSFGNMNSEHADKMVQAFKQDKNAFYFADDNANGSKKKGVNNKVCKNCNGKFYVDDKDEKGFNMAQQFVKDGSVADGGDKLGYVWGHSQILAIIGFGIFLVLLLMITVQIGVRTINIIFFYIITPLCATSLTNYNNPQAFIIWKNSILGSICCNFAQIMMLSLFGVICTSINRIPNISGVALTYAQLILFLAGLSATLSIGQFVQSMFGGYGAGNLEGMRQLASLGRSVVATIGGAISGTGAATSVAGNLVSKGMEKTSTVAQKMSNQSSKAESNIARANELKSSNNTFDRLKGGALSGLAKVQSGIGSAGNRLVNSNGFNRTLSTGFSAGRFVNNVGNSVNKSGNFMRGRGFNVSNMPFNADQARYFDGRNRTQFNNMMYNNPFSNNMQQNKMSSQNRNNLFRG